MFTPLLLVAAILCQGDPQPPAAVDEVVAARWVERPSARDFAAVYPRRAAEGRVSGRVLLQCRIGSEGEMLDCNVIEETPPRYRFGAAALQLAGKFRMSTHMADGRPTAGGTMTIPIRFASN